MKKNLCILVFLASVTVWGMGSPSNQIETTNTYQESNGKNTLSHHSEKSEESKSKYTPEQIRSMAGEASGQKR